MLPVLVLQFRIVLTSDCLRHWCNITPPATVSPSQTYVYFNSPQGTQNCYSIKLLLFKAIFVLNCSIKQVYSSTFMKLVVLMLFKSFYNCCRQLLKCRRRRNQSILFKRCNLSTLSPLHATQVLNCFSWHCSQLHSILTLWTLLLWCSIANFLRYSYW